MFKRMAAVMALLSMVLLLISPVLAFDSGMAVTTADWLNFRTQPDMSGRVIDLIPANSEVDIIQDLGDWCLIEWNDIYGYVSAQYLAQEMPAPQQEAPGARFSDSSAQSAAPADVVFGIVIGDEVRFRKVDSLSGDIYGFFYHGVIVEVLEEGPQWTQIDFGGTVGYIASQYIRIGTPTSEELVAAENAFYISAYQSAPASPAQPTQQAAAQPEKQSAVRSETQSATQTQAWNTKDVIDGILATALSCEGITYRSGGASPWQGFDCSGFTYYVFGQNGISLSRTASAQYLQGTSVSKSDLQPGDLLFFTNEDSWPNVGHVGIYLGDGKLIHASTGHWEIHIADLYSQWFVTNYIGARRIVK